MVLKTISITHFGGIKDFSFSFSNSLNILKERYSEELFLAIATVLHNRSTPRIPKFWICRESRIDAEVSVNEKMFCLTILPSEDENGVKLSAFDGEGSEVTKEYLYLSSHCEEQDLSDVFDGEDRTLLRFLRYAEELYDDSNELSKQTDGFSSLKIFRKYLRSFIENFQPEVIRDGKRYEIILKKDGRYCVRCSDGGFEAAFLSESERTLFRYLCFLRTAEFWQGFEEIRDLHSVKKPLVVKDFLDRLDQSIDVSELFDRTLKLGRQMIVLT